MVSLRGTGLSVPGGMFHIGGALSGRKAAWKSELKEAVRRVMTQVVTHRLAETSWRHTRYLYPEPPSVRPAIGSVGRTETQGTISTIHFHSEWLWPILQ